MAQGGRHDLDRTQGRRPLRARDRWRNHTLRDRAGSVRVSAMTYITLGVVVAQICMGIVGAGIYLDGWRLHNTRRELKSFEGKHIEMMTFSVAGKFDVLVPADTVVYVVQIWPAGGGGRP